MPAPRLWKFATPVLAVLSSVLIGGVAESFGSCHSGVSSLENQLFASAMAQIKSVGQKLDLVAAVGHSELNPKTGLMYLQKRSQKSLLQLSLPCCGNPYYLY